jgi:hypothetical protein
MGTQVLGAMPVLTGIIEGAKRSIATIKAVLTTLRVIIGRSMTSHSALSRVWHLPAWFLAVRTKTAHQFLLPIRREPERS